jgi:hypothetical protein
VSVLTFLVFFPSFFHASLSLCRAQGVILRQRLGHLISQATLVKA